LDFSSGNDGFIEESGVGFQTVMKFIITILETYIDFSTIVVQKVNPKDTFVKLAQHNFQWTPKFYEINVCDKDNTKEHTISIKNNEDFIIAVATGETRKLAEINASEKALKYYGWS
jgi:dsRNA-specific ribonuclease